MAIEDSQMHRGHSATQGLSCRERGLLEEGITSTAARERSRPWTVSNTPVRVPTSIASAHSKARTEPIYRNRNGVRSSNSVDASAQMRRKRSSTCQDTGAVGTGALRTEIEIQLQCGSSHMIHFPVTPNTALDSAESPSSEGQGFTAITLVQNDNKGRDRRYNHLEVKRERLRALRPQILETRSLVAERRSELAELRLVISYADGKFMKFIREQRAQAALLEGKAELILEKLFQELQAARDRYGVSEDEYNVLENRLDREEYDMKLLEEYCSTHGGAMQQITPCNTDEADSLSESDHSEEDDFEIGFKSHHSLEDEFLSRLGDADLCKEAHDQLVFEHHRLLRAKEQRLRFGKSLLPEDETILGEFQLKEAEILRELTIIERDVERLRAACIEEGLLDGYEDEMDILELPIDPEQAQYSRFPLLLHNDEKAFQVLISDFDEETFQELISDFDEKTFRALISDFEVGNPGNRITRWLLHKLGSSCSEVELYARVSHDMGSRSDNTTWQQDVLRHWFHDSANKPASDFVVGHTLTTFITSSQADDRRTLLCHSESSLPINLLKYSSALYQHLECGFLLKQIGMAGRSTQSV